MDIKNKKLESLLANSEKLVLFLSSNAASVPQVCSVKFESTLRKMMFQAVSKRSHDDVYVLLRAIKYLAEQNQVNGIKFLISSGLPDVLGELMGYISTVMHDGEMTLAVSTFKLFMENLMLILPLMTDNCKWLKSEFVRLLNLTWNSYHHLEMSTVAIDILNQILVSLSREVIYAIRNIVANNSMSMAICAKMVGELAEVGDYQVQAGVVEVIVRITSSSLRCKCSLKWNDNDEKLAGSFSDITYHGFDHSVRHYLNAVNGKLQPPKVRSFPLKMMELGSETFLHDCWLDFCLCSKNITLSFSTGDEEESRFCESLDSTIILDYKATEMDLEFCISMFTNLSLQHIFDNDVVCNKGQTIRLFLCKETAPSLEECHYLLHSILGTSKEDLRQSLPCDAVIAHTVYASHDKSNSSTCSFSQDMVPNSQPMDCKGSKPTSPLPLVVTSGRTSELRSRLGGKLEIAKVKINKKAERKEQEQTAHVLKKSPIVRTLDSAYLKEMVPETQVQCKSDAELKQSCSVLHLSQLQATQGTAVEKNVAENHIIITNPSTDCSEKNPVHHESQHHDHAHCDSTFDETIRDGFVKNNNHTNAVKISKSRHMINSLRNGALHRGQSESPVYEAHSDGACTMTSDDCSAKVMELGVVISCPVKDQLRALNNKGLKQQLCTDTPTTLELHARGEIRDAVVSTTKIKGSPKQTRQKFSVKKKSYKQRKNSSDNHCCKTSCFYKGTSRFRSDKTCSEKIIPFKNTTVANAQNHAVDLHMTDGTAASTVSELHNVGKERHYIRDHSNVKTKKKHKVNKRCAKLRQEADYGEKQIYREEREKCNAVMDKQLQSTNAVTRDAIVSSRITRSRNCFDHHKDGLSKAGCIPCKIKDHVNITKQENSPLEEKQRNLMAKCTRRGVDAKYSATDVANQIMNIDQEVYQDGGGHIQENSTHETIRQDPPIEKTIVFPESQNSKKQKEVSTSARKIRFTIDHLNQSRAEQDNSKKGEKKLTKLKNVFDSSGLSSVASTCSELSWVKSFKGEKERIFENKKLRTFPAKRKVMLSGPLSVIEKKVESKHSDQLKIGEVMSSPEVGRDACLASPSLLAVFPNKSASVIDPWPLHLPASIPSLLAPPSDEYPGMVESCTAELLEEMHDVASLQARNNSTPSEKSSKPDTTFKQLKKNHYQSCPKAARQPKKLRYNPTPVGADDTNQLLTSDDGGGFGSDSSSPVGGLLDGLKAVNETRMKGLKDKISRNIDEVYNEWNNFKRRRCESFDSHCTKLDLLSDKHNKLMDRIQSVEEDHIVQLRNHQSKIENFLKLAFQGAADMKESNHNFFEHRFSLEDGFSDAMEKLDDDVTNELQKLVAASSL